MKSTGYIALFNATRNELHELDNNLQVENYWRAIDMDELVYVLDDYAWVDGEELAEWEHEDFIEAGWTVLQ